MMKNETRLALVCISESLDGADYKKVTKNQLWEALKSARHMAKFCLKNDPE